MKKVLIGLLFLCFFSCEKGSNPLPEGYKFKRTGEVVGNWWKPNNDNYDGLDRFLILTFPNDYFENDTVLVTKKEYKEIEVGELYVYRTAKLK